MMQAQSAMLDSDNIVWNSESKNAGESMPCGGGDIGLNVWVEGGDLLCYVARSGSFDENNTLLKSGRIRIHISPNPFTGAAFRQELSLKDGANNISGTANGISATAKIWVDVFRPVVHFSMHTNKPVVTTVAYESWRYEDRILQGKENNENSWKWAPQGIVKTAKDSITFSAGGIIFFHRNSAQTVFDAAVRQQGLLSIKDSLDNPLKNLTSGGILQGKNMRFAGIDSGKYLSTKYKSWRLESKTAARSQELTVCLYTAQTKNTGEWNEGLKQQIYSAEKASKTALYNTQQWWQQFWNRSFIFIDPNTADTANTAWQSGRNYQLFRYMLGCNAFGKYPTKFNGGLFTFDPVLTDTSLPYTPDFRNWGGGTFTAQNQRLVYHPMLRSGDFDMLRPQLDFYVKLLQNAEMRSRLYWHHNGACFTEQLENFGLPNPAEYGWKRPSGYDPGMEYNAWLEYEWDTALEFCGMMLDDERYAGSNISSYIPFIESCLTFFNEHYTYLAKQRGRKELDGNGHLVLYPGSAGETYKMAYNSTSTIAALKTVLARLLALPEHYLTATERTGFRTMLSHIPPITFRSFEGHATIAPAALWERINNVETMQLYAVFPWGIYGVGRSGLDTARNTWMYDTSAIKFRSYIGWKQDNIFAARLGLAKDAAKLTFQKLKNSGRRFPAFWGPGYDWVPDHNWGGSGMIGLQEMLLQTDGSKIYLFTAWPVDLDVHFKLCAPYNTTVEGVVKNGKVVSVTVLPESRTKDIINLFGKDSATLTAP